VVLRTPLVFSIALMSIRHLALHTIGSTYQGLSLAREAVRCSPFACLLGARSRTYEHRHQYAPH
jgi:hypothetical protein